MYALDNLDNKVMHTVNLQPATIFMETSTTQILKNKLERFSTPTTGIRCLSCGKDHIKPGRRYCSKECRLQINWVLSLSKGLLKAFSARYAAFSFTENHVILDVLPIWSKGISRFVLERANGRKPAEDLKNLILESGREWHHMVENHNSRSYASLFLLEKNQKKNINPETIKPNRKDRLRLSKQEKKCLKILKLEREDLSSEGQKVKIKAAYKKMAKVHHPDIGGDAEKFRQLSDAHRQMLIWAENPQYTSRKALQDCWSYDGTTNRWSPPL
jgi:hypothetical protein